MKYDRKTRAWFRMEMTGKSAFAQGMDLLLTSLFALFACYIWFLARLQSQSLAVFLAVLSALVLGGIILLWRSMRLDTFIRKYSAQLRSNALLEHLLLQPTESIRLMIEKAQVISDSHQIGKDLLISRGCLYGIVQKHPNEPYGASELLKFYQIALAHKCSGIQIYSTTSPSDDARSLAGQFSIPIVLHEAEELIAIAGQAEMLPKDDVVKHAMEQNIALRRNKRKDASKGLFVPVNTRRYLYCAGVIMLSSFITGYRIYYPMMAALCVCLALMSWYLGRKDKKREASSEQEEAQSQSAHQG